MMKIGYKFCGGCNPTCDRAACLERVRQALAGRADFEFVREDGIYDRILVFHGCQAGCGQTEGLKSRDGISHIHSMEEAGQIAGAIPAE